MYASDTLLTALMCSKSSNFPWDMAVIKKGNLLILDSQIDREPISFIDLTSINENAQELLPDDEKDIYDLCVQATKITNNLQAQAFKGEVWQVSQEPIQVEDFEEREFSHRYVEWRFENIVVNVRSKLDGYVKVGDELKPCILRTLNENSSETDWRKSIATQKGAFRSKEFINNSNNFTRWLSTMELA